MTDLYRATNSDGSQSSYVASAYRTVTSTTATITNGTTTSGAITTTGQVLCGIQLPAAFTGTSVTFQVSYDGNTYVALYDETNTQVSVTVSTSRAYSLPPYLFAPWGYVKIVSGSSEGADRTIGLVLIAV